tara:strand:- start:7372 stop:7647 length:276 start_codon:yes stop_codon:yes gene_type:complete
MNEQIKMQMEQDFAQNGSILSASATRFSANISHVSEESSKLWQLKLQLIGATAQNLLEQHGQANLQTQLKSSGMFPGVQSIPSPGNAGPAS